MDQNSGLRDFFESGFYEEYWPEADDESSVKELAHLSGMLEKAGFITEYIYGDFEGTAIDFDSTKIVLLARK